MLSPLPLTGLYCIKNSMKELHKRVATGLVLGVLVIVTLLFCPSWVFATFAALLLITILSTEWPLLMSYKDPFFWLLTPLYPVLPFLLIIIMQITGYEPVNILLISMVAVYDTGSYLVGKKWGTHKISPSISPGKTWEGFLGGITLTFLFSLLFFSHLGIQTLFTKILPFTIALCISALCGDLFESYLKRRAGVKDSGSVLPGHGGLLDRIDGIMFATPLAYLFRRSLTLMLGGAL